MESFMFYLLPLLLLPLSLYLIFFIVKYTSDDRKTLPPGSMGWPIIGENINLAISGFPKFLQHRMEKHSPAVFQTSLFGEKMAVFCGARGNKFLFTNDKKLITKWIPLSLTKVFFPEFERSLKEPAALFHNFRYEVLKPEAMKQYIPVMDEVAREHVNKFLMPNSVMKMHPSSKKFTFVLACKLFMNLDDLARVETLLEPFSRMSDGMLSLPVDFPGTAFNRAIKASKIVHCEMLKIVKERRKKDCEGEMKGVGQDLLSKMLVLTDEEGRYVSDSKVANFFVGLLLVSFDLTSSATTFVLYYLAQLPHIYEEVLRENMEIAKSKGPNELLTWKDVEKMKYSWNVVRETLRIASPLLGSFSEATSEFTYAGFTVPKGWKLLWSTHSTHYNPKYFPEPEKFDPSRFEGSGPEPYAFIPFGAGSRICAGRDYAKLAILVFIHNVVTKLRLKKAIPDEKMVLHIRASLPHGLPLLLYPHEE